MTDIAAAAPKVRAFQYLGDADGEVVVTELARRGAARAVPATAVARR